MESRRVLLVFLLHLFIIAEPKELEKPIEITEENWRNILEGEWMVELLAPWCPACRAFQPKWEAFAKWSRDLDISVAVIDVTKSPGLSGRFLITSLPTIYHVIDGEFRRFTGNRDENDLVAFVQDLRWKQIEPVSYWTHPNSFQMSVVGFFFKTAMVVREFYSMMTSEYGIPEWCCYLIFGVLTIIVGLLLGLIIVCCCDFMFPPKYSHRNGKPSLLSKSEEEFFNRETQDIVDDLPEDNVRKDDHQDYRQDVDEQEDDEQDGIDQDSDQQNIDDEADNLKDDSQEEEEGNSAEDVDQPDGGNVDSTNVTSSARRRQPVKTD